MKFIDKNNNIFIDIYSFVNRLFTIEDYMLNRVSVELNKYLYIAHNIELNDAKYLNYNNKDVNIFIIRSRDGIKEPFSDIILFQDILTLIVIIPDDTEDDDSIKLFRSNLIVFIYNSICSYLSTKYISLQNSSFSIILNNASLVLSVLTERNIFYEVNSEFYNNIKNEKQKELLYEVLNHSIEDLFKYGGLYSLIKELKVDN